MRIRVPAPGRRALPALGLVALGAFLVARTPAALVATWERLARASVETRDDADAALAKQRGEAYATAIREIRARLPEKETYVVMEGARGADMIVRFDLAPRCAVFGGRPQDISRNFTQAQLASLPRWAVIPDVATGVPRLVLTRTLAEKGETP